jgi:glutathione S-transferase
MFELEYTAGSPYALAIRVMLHEIDLKYVRSEPKLAPTPMQVGADTPTMQVPTLTDGDVVLWESGTIAEYLLSKYSTRVEDEPQLASAMWCPKHEWEDKLLFSTIQTFGAAVTTISQLT